jgi:hypothetical protein
MCVCACFWMDVCRWDELMDGWMDGWLVGWMNGWMDEGWGHTRAIPLCLLLVLLAA